MARQRMVKPEFFDSESLARCSVAARLAFIGLWVECDDYGRLKFQPNRLKTRIFPYDKMTVKKFVSLLLELEAVGCIRGYEIGGETFIDVPNFSVYQTVKKPSKTANPEYRKEYSTPLVDHWYPTSDPKERKKEGMLLSNNNNIPKEDGASGAGAGTAPLCPVCGRTVSTHPLTRRPYCWKCEKEVAL